MFLLVEGAGAKLDAPAILDTAGVKRIVLQSAQAVHTRPGVASHAPLHAIEDQVRRSSLDWTILRPGGFASNAFAWADPVRPGGRWPHPSATSAPVIDPDDIAEVAATALRGSRPANTAAVSRATTVAPMS